MDSNQIAKICHEANKAYCESIGDNSQPSWDEALDWQKTSAVNGVEMHLLNPGVSASGSHDSWLKFKKEDGWKYGSVKDEKKKEHPCIVPFEQLPIEQQAKDYLFRGIVHSLSHMVK